MNVRVLLSASSLFLLAISAFAADENYSEFSFGLKTTHRTFVADDSDLDKRETKGNLSGIFLEYQRLKKDSFYWGVFLDSVAGKVEKRNISNSGVRQNSEKIDANAVTLDFSAGYNFSIKGYEHWLVTPYTGIGAYHVDEKYNDTDMAKLEYKMPYFLLGIMSEYQVMPKLVIGGDFRLRFVRNATLSLKSIELANGATRDINDISLDSKTQYGFYVPVKYKFNDSWAIKAVPYIENRSIGGGVVWINGVKVKFPGSKTTITGLNLGATYLF